MTQRSTPMVADDFSITIRQRRESPITVLDAEVQVSNSRPRLIGTYEMTDDSWPQVSAAVYGRDGRLVGAVEVFVDSGEGYGTFEEALDSLDTDIITRIELLVRSQ